MENSADNSAALKTNEIDNYEETLEFFVEREKRIKILQQQCIDLKNEEQETREALSNLENENKLLQERVNLLYKEAEALKRYEDEHQNDYEIPFEADLSEKLRHLCCLLNYHETEFTTRNQRAQMTLHFNKCCYVQLEIDNSYELLHIEPMPKKFTDIKQFMQQTQDIQGFLLMLRNYFIYTTRRKEENPEIIIN